MQEEKVCFGVRPAVFRKDTIYYLLQLWLDAPDICGPISTTAGLVG